MVLRTRLALIAACSLSAACTASQDLGNRLDDSSSGGASSSSSAGGANTGGLGAGGGPREGEWALQLTGVANQSVSRVEAVATDGDNNVLAVGTVAGPITVGGRTYPAPINGNTAFVAKVDDAGTAQWVKLLGLGASYGTYAGADASNNVFVGGYFEGEIDVGLGAMSTPEGAPQGFVIVFSPDGEPIRQHQIGSSAPHQGMGGSYFQFAVSKAGELAYAQTFTGTVDPGNGPLTAHSPGMYGGDILVAKYDANFDVLFQTSFGDADDGNDMPEVLGPIGLAPDGGVVVSGSYGGTINIGGGLSATSPAGKSEDFVASFGADGHPVFLDSIDADNLELLSMVVSPTGDIWLSAEYSGSVDIAGITMPFDPLYTTFIAALDATGHATKSRVVKSKGPWSLWLGTDAHGDVVVAGSADGSFDLGAGQVDVNAKQEQVFAVFDSSLKPITSRYFPMQAIGGASFEVVTLDGSGHVVIGGNVIANGDIGVADLHACSGCMDPFLVRYAP